MMKNRIVYRLLFLVCFTVLLSTILIKDGSIGEFRLLMSLTYDNFGLLMVIGLFNIIMAYYTSYWYSEIIVHHSPFINSRPISALFKMIRTPMVVFYFACVGFWVIMATRNVLDIVEIIMAVVLLFIQLSFTAIVYFFLCNFKGRLFIEVTKDLNYAVVLTTLFVLSGVFQEYTVFSKWALDYSPFIGLFYNIFILD